MAIFRKRFSNQDLIQLLVFVAFPSHVWAVIHMLHDVPGWLYYMKTSEVVAAISYTLTFALFETLIVFLAFYTLGTLVPERWWKGSFVTLSSVWLVELTFMAYIFQELVLLYLPKRNVILGLFLILVLTALAVPRVPRLRQIGRTISERLTILTFLYLFIDVLGMINVIARNV